MKKSTRQGKRAPDQETFTVSVPISVKQQLTRLADEAYPGEKKNLSRYVRKIINEHLKPGQTSAEIV